MACRINSQSPGKTAGNKSHVDYLRAGGIEFQREAAIRDLSCRGLPSHGWKTGCIGYPYQVNAGAINGHARGATATVLRLLIEHTVGNNKGREGQRRVDDQLLMPIIGSQFECDFAFVKEIRYWNHSPVFQPQIGYGPF